MNMEKIRAEGFEISFFANDRHTANSSKIKRACKLDIRTCPESRLAVCANHCASGGYAPKPHSRGMPLPLTTGNGFLPARFGKVSGAGSVLRSELLCHVIGMEPR